MPQTAQITNTYEGLDFNHKVLDVEKSVDYFKNVLLLKRMKAHF